MKPRSQRRAKVFGALSLGSFGFVFVETIFSGGQFWAVLGNVRAPAAPNRSPRLRRGRGSRSIHSLVKDHTGTSPEACARLTHACARNYQESLDFLGKTREKKSSPGPIFRKSFCAFDARTAQCASY